MGFNSNYFFPNQYPHSSSYPSTMLSEQSRFSNNPSSRHCLECEETSPERHSMHSHHHHNVVSQQQQQQLPPQSSHQQRRNGVATTTNGWSGGRKDFQRLEGESPELSDLAEVSQGEGRRFASGTLLLTTEAGSGKDYDPLAKVQVCVTRWGRRSRAYAYCWVCLWVNFLP